MTDHQRNEYIADALLDEDDRHAWEQQRTVDLGLERGWVTTEEMIASLAAERRAAENAQPVEQWAPYQRERLRWVAALAVERQEGDAA